MVKQGKYENTIEVTLTEKNTPILFKKKLEELMEQKAFDSETKAKKWIENTPIVLCLVYHKHSGLYAVEDEAVDSTFSPYDSVVPTDTINEDPDPKFIELCQPIMNNTQYTPEELYDWQVFPDEDTLVLYMQSKGYSQEQYTIQYYEERDIEDYVLIDEYGNSIQSAETEEDLDDAYNELVGLVGNDRIEIEPTKLYATEEALYGMGSNEQYTAIAVSKDEVDFDNGQSEILELLQDVDDYKLLIDAVKKAQSENHKTTEEDIKALAEFKKKFSE